jgi:hypothetical protein
MLFKLFLLPFFLFFTAASASERYSIEDLKVLAQEEALEEYISHAYDIRPMERTEIWKGLSAKIADLYSKKLAQQNEISPKEFKNLEILWAWPGIKNDDIFNERRREIGLRYLKFCSKLASPCLSEIKKFWQESRPEDSETAFQISQLISGLPSSPLPLWDLLNVALKSNQSEFYCQKTFVMEELWKKISSELLKFGPKGDLTKKIDELVHPDCLYSLVQEAKKRLEAPTDKLDRETAFQILKSQYKATEDLTDFFYCLYLLENPSRGETFNYSWNRITQLGKSVLRREKVIELMKKLDPFPDELLGSLDESKMKTILMHFHHHFPEIIDLYVSTCLAYYSGQKIFSQGNPTLHCEKLMNSEIGEKIIERALISKFHSLKKI